MTALTKESINEIAQELDLGFKCFWNRKTNELLFIPDELRHDGFEMDAWEEDLKKLKKNKKDYIEIEGMASRDSFKIMEQFVNTIEDNEGLQQQLINALGRRKPFAEFKYLIDDSGDYRKKWFNFKDQKLQEWVRAQIEL